MKKTLIICFLLALAFNSIGQNIHTEHWPLTRLMDLAMVGQMTTQRLRKRNKKHLKMCL